MLPRNVLYYGKGEPLAERIPLRAGPLSLVYEAGDLRYVKLGDKEILRRVYVAIRDRNWDTILPQFSNMQMEMGADEFFIAYDVENIRGEIDFRWHGELRGERDGSIHLSMDGEAHSSFARNRIGFCILHPMAVAGSAARIEHVDGSVEESIFPVQIAPQLVIDGLIKPVAPFEEMAAVTHEVIPGVWAEVRFSGEIFETEDQRNWTDASYKTYGTPLRLPFPVEIQQGTKIAQTVTLTLRGESSGQFSVGSDQLAVAPVSVAIDDAQTKAPQRLPLLGLGVASHGQPLDAQEVERLRTLNLNHLRVDLPLSQPTYADTLRRATSEALALGIELEVALQLSENAEGELWSLWDMLQRVDTPVQRWLIFKNGEKSTTAQWVDLARKFLGSYRSQAAFGGGTNVYFSELNRARPPVQALDVVAYSLNPQVHAFDNSSLAETLAAQAATAQSARRFCGDRPLAVSPVTLQPRFNPNATGPEPEPTPGELPSQVDVRQMSLFGAGWTLGSIKYLAESGEVASITYYETSGWRGVMETAIGSPLPAKFRSIAGGVFPLYHVLADVGEFAGGDVLPAASSEPLRVEVLALHKNGRQRMLLANLTDQPQQVSIMGFAPQVSLRLLDETNAEHAMQEPEVFRAQVGEHFSAQDGGLVLELLPYAIICVDQA
jgi:hypothetical protein